MKRLFEFIKKPIPMWLLIPLLFFAAVPLVAAPPIWYGGLNLDQGSVIQDPGAPANACVGTNALGVYVYNSNCSVSTPPPLPLSIANGGTATSAPSPSASTGCQVSGTWPANIFGCPNHPQVFASPTAQPLSNPHIEIFELDASITCSQGIACVYGDYFFKQPFVNGATCTAGPFRGTANGAFILFQNSAFASTTSAVSLAIVPTNTSFSGSAAKGVGICVGS